MDDTNSHTVLDDARSYLTSKGLLGHHQCCSLQSNEENHYIPARVHSTTPKKNGHTKQKDVDELQAQGKIPHKLLVWSTSNGDVGARVTESLNRYLKAHVASSEKRFGSLANTLASRRTHMEWRKFAVMGYRKAEFEALPAMKPTHGFRQAP